ncbi:hypothetical protein ACP4OV_010377 [Aristida adscensionis]
MAKPRKNAAANGVIPHAAAEPSPSRSPSPEQKRKRARRRSDDGGPFRRSSAYRGVTRHRWTGRFEAHLWDKDAARRGTATATPKKGKQVYLGAYDGEEAAARAHDLAALKYWGPATLLNFPVCRYEEEVKEMEAQSREEYVASIRRRSNGFSRGVSKYRGVARHHHNGRWEARIGRVVGNKYLYLATEEAAAVAYDLAAIEHRGLNAVTNFDIGHYIRCWDQHRRGLAGGGGGAREIAPTELPEDDLLLAKHPNQAMASAAAAAAAAHNDDNGENCHHEQQPAPSSSALELLLLQSSPKFKETMEQLWAATSLSSSSSESNAGSSSLSSSSSSSSCSPPQPLSPEPQPELGAAPPARGSGFPDDVQRWFECDDEDGMGFSYADIDTFLFGDLVTMFDLDDV